VRRTTWYLFVFDSFGFLHQICWKLEVAPRGEGGGNPSVILGDSSPLRILVEVLMQIRPIDGEQNINCSASFQRIRCNFTTTPFTECIKVQVLIKKSGLRGSTGVVLQNRYLLSYLKLHTHGHTNTHTSVPSDFGRNKAEIKKMTKYQDLSDEVKISWKLKIHNCSGDHWSNGDEEEEPHGVLINKQWGF